MRQRGEMGPCYHVTFEPFRKIQLYSQSKEEHLGTSLVVQWIRLCAPNAGDTGSIPDWWTKILQATRHSQKKKKIWRVLSRKMTSQVCPLKDDSGWNLRNRLVGLVMKGGRLVRTDSGDIMVTWLKNGSRRNKDKGWLAEISCRWNEQSLWLTV